MTINLRPIVDKIARVGVVATIVGTKGHPDGIGAIVEIRKRWFFGPALWLLGTVLRVLVRLRLAHVVTALLFLPLTACTSAYNTLTATARAGSAAAAEFRAWDAQHKRQLLAAARPSCAPAPDPRACYALALQPYQQQREPALKAADLIGALLRQAAAVGQVSGSPSRLTAEIAEGIRTLALELAKMRSKP